MSESPNFGNISLRQLRAFVTVAEVGSFTTAAAAINLTQSAVSLLIRGLETDLGLKLLDRTTRSVQLTDSGREFLGPARQLLVDLQAAVLTSRELAEKKRGRVRIAASPIFSSQFLPGIIARYRSRYPQIDIVVKDVPAGRVRQLVLDGEVDLGVGTTLGLEPPFAWETIVADEVVPIFRPDHPLARKKTVAWAQLAKFPCIMIGQDVGTRQIINARLGELGIVIEPAFEVESALTIVGMVTAGLGVGITTGLVRLLAPIYNFRIGRLQGEPLKQPIALFWHGKRSLSPAVTSFRDCMCEPGAIVLDLQADTHG